MQALSIEFSSLTAKQAKCLPLLAVGMTASDVSKKLKVSQVQISEWRHDPNFMTALDTIRRNALRDAEIALTGLAMDAVQVLRESLNNSTSEQAKLRAAMFVIDRLGFSTNLETLGEGASGTVNMALLLTALGAKSGSPK